MINLRNSPFLWLSLILLFSIRISAQINNELPHWSVVILYAICIASSLLTIRSYLPNFQYKSTLFICILIISSGILRVNEFKKSLYPSGKMPESVFMEGIVEIKQVLKVKESGTSIRCQTISLSATDTIHAQHFTDKFLLVNVKSASTVTFFPGDIIGIRGYVSAIDAPKNPYAFDARIHYNTIGIRHTMSCKSEEVQRDFPEKKSLARLTARWQFFLSSLVKRHVRPEVAQLTNALVWGDRSDMDEEVRDAFADSGAMHVLSVSGMHVAIIYSMLLLFLGAPGAGNLIQRLVRFFTYSFAIILYMGLAGACPAVVRAGLMIILFLFGKALGWNTQIWNLLGFAAFVMFWLNPFIGQNIGFQLSFLAMAGILLFAKPMIRSLNFKNIILHRLWEITALSITAQVFIVPVLLGQFHQFPLTFIISSFVAIPAAYIVMAGAMLNVVLSLLGIHFLWPIVDWSGHLFILTMKWMSELNPLMYYSLPSVSAILIMSMAIIFSFAVVFKLPWGKKLVYVLGVMAFLNLSCHRAKQWSTKELIIYHSYKGLAIDIVENGKCISFHNCQLTPSSLEFTMRGYRCERDVIEVKEICTSQDFARPLLKFENQLLSIKEINMLVWNGSAFHFKGDHDLDYIIIDDCPNKHELQNFLCSHSTAHVILPAHLNRKIRKPIQFFMNENQIRYYDIDQDGYFKIAL
ncbi:MAG: ComEC/Rec2 family competence protein [Saprospiraceae bacterium]